MSPHSSSPNLPSPCDLTDCSQGWSLETGVVTRDGWSLETGVVTRDGWSLETGVVTREVLYSCVLVDDRTVVMPGHTQSGHDGTTLRGPGEL